MMSCRSELSAIHHGLVINVTVAQVLQAPTRSARRRIVAGKSNQKSCVDVDVSAAQDQVRKPASLGGI